MRAIAQLAEAVPPKLLWRHRAGGVMLTEELVGMGHEVALFAPVVRLRMLR
jgi:hypothetical protein